MTLSRYILTFLAFVALALTSCMDDRLYNPDDFEIGDGVCNLPVTVSFHDLEPALESRSAGNAVNEIEQLWVVIYSVVNGKAVYYDKVKANTLPGYSVENGTTEPGDAESGDNLGPTGEATPRAKFTLNNIPFGRYQLYAVANLDLDDYDLSAEGQNNPDYLKSRTIAWETVGETENPDFSKINAMFGYFTPAEDQTSKGFEAPTLILNKETVNLHSWIKRLVSKVTISYDASELNEAVRVYIKSVTIHDIPKNCFLGKDNTPNSDDEIIKNGEQFIYYSDGAAATADHKKWLTLSRGKDNKTGGEVNHYESDRALYFFENMQNINKEPDKPEHYYDKAQQLPDNPDGVGKPIDKPEDGEDYKDKLEFGTYIEVEAYYEGRLTEGPIKYRFMLGKDIKDNYDAERNFHYKLTLKFRGKANEADWHISYKEYTPTLLVHEPYYISYLYGQSLDFPARILTGDENVKNYTVKAEIIENNWWPYDEATNTIPPASAGSGEYGFAWFEAAYNAIYKVENQAANHSLNNTLYDGFAGFLSLHPNEFEEIGELGLPEGQGGRPMSTADYSNGNLRYYGPNANKWLKKYYNEKKIWENEYPLNGSNAEYNPVDQSVTLKIPMYTRQRQMVPGSDFSGNNPFNCYSRLSRVKFTLWDSAGKQVTFKDSEGNDIKEKICRIIQVPRIENPKAIYRNHDNDDPFDVKLMIVPVAGSETYETFKSDGPWRASIMCQTDDNFIWLDSPDGQKVRKKGEYIHGSTDDPIEFTYTPNGTIGANQTRCGVIMVEYNDYNCVHLIAVRQGYHAPIQFAPGQAKWSSYNVYATGQATTSMGVSNPPQTSVGVALTRSPLSIGTYYKRLQYNYGYMEKNEATYGWNDTPANGAEFTVSYLDGNSWATKSAIWGWAKLLDDKKYEYYGPQAYGWYNSDKSENRWDAKYVWADTWTAKTGFQDGQEFTVPTADDFKYLIENCKFGFGIAYADGAIETKKDFKTVYGYKDVDNKAISAQNGEGVRVCVIYDEFDGKNFLFPLGASGMGRRTRNMGLLSYGGTTSLLTATANYYRPLVYNLYRFAGATYWIKQAQTKVENGTTVPDYAAWDINYFSVRFSHYDSGSLWGAASSDGTWQPGALSDACPIKLIYK